MRGLRAGAPPFLRDQQSAHYKTKASEFAQKAIHKGISLSYIPISLSYIPWKRRMATLLEENHCSNRQRVEASSPGQEDTDISRLSLLTARAAAPASTARRKAAVAMTFGFAPGARVE